MPNDSNKVTYPIQVNIDSNGQGVLHPRGSTDQAIRSAPEDSGEDHRDGISSHQSRNKKKTPSQRNQGRAQTPGSNEHLRGEKTSSRNETNPQTSMTEGKRPGTKTTRRDK